MIVDDEQIVREGLRYTINDFFGGTLKIVAEAKNGREALLYFEEQKPDIVLMDIQMPGINGLETIKEIKDIQSNTKFIIVSAFEQFEYAKEALTIGVKDYISKPINDTRLQDVLNNIIKEIDNERLKRMNVLNIQEKLDRMHPIIECGFIYSILLNVDQNNSRSYYSDFLKINDLNGYVMVIDFLDVDGSKAIENDGKYQSIRNTIKFKCDAIVGPLMVNRIVIVIKDNQKLSEYQQRVYAVDLAESLYKSLSSLLSCKMIIGIGSSYAVNHLNASYQEALKVLRKITDENILHIEDVVHIHKDVSGYSYAEIKAAEEVIMEQVEDGKTLEVQALIQKFYKKLFEVYNEKPDVIRNISMELMVILNMIVYRNDVESKCYFEHTYLDEVMNTQNLIDLKNKIIENTLQITEFIRNEKSQKASQVVTDAIDYIKNHYSDDIRLKDVAEEVSISPHYFSKIFKDEMGLNFIDYLTDHRLNKAKVMLKENNESIKNIAYSIGYNDPNYFSRLFKKIVGMTPKEYQR
ncbi:MAG: response regulator [Clostridiales bacterium]|nr:response regulator [Clostridiales bacterium]